ncbi:hypothetical protein [Brevundimonas abyssalis]|uniref:hypothetical protein n=1 Tax=Brevundimonas abyssalis TaxID=1125965 RepID=UPI0035A21FEB
MAVSDSPTEIFKRALAHAARALAEQPDLEVAFGSDGPKLAGHQLTLPTPPRDPSGPEAQALRGQADRMALRLANHDEGLNARLRPADASAAEVFDAVEQTRIEAVGAMSLKGVRENMNAALVSRLHRMGAAAATEAQRVPVAEAVGLLVRERLTGEPAPDGLKAMVDLVRADLEARAGDQLDALTGLADDQAAFGTALKDVLRALDLDPGDGRGEDASDDPGEEAPDPQEPDAADDQDEDEAGGEGGQSMEARPTTRGPRTSARTGPRADARTARPSPATAIPSCPRATSPNAGPTPTTAGPPTATAPSPPPSTRPSGPKSCAIPMSWRGCDRCWTSSWCSCPASWRGWPTGCSAACWPSRTGRGCSTWRKACWTPPA